MWGYFCVGFIDFMLKGKSLLEYTNLFSANNYEKNDEYFVNCIKYRKCKKPKISYLLEKALFFLLFAVSVKMKMKKSIRKYIIMSEENMNQEFRMKKIYR